MKNKVTKFIFVRHGETDQNIDMVAGRAAKEFDYPLNTRGVQQARQVRDELAGDDADIIISSPMERAKMTAEIINQERQVPMVIEPDLRERSVGGVTMTTWHELFDMDKNIKPEGIATERVREFFERVYVVIDKLAKKYRGKTIIIVAHGGVHHAFHAYFNNLPWKGNVRIDKLHNADIRYYQINNEEKDR